MSATKTKNSQTQLFEKKGFEKTILASDFKETISAEKFTSTPPTIKLVLGGNFGRVNRFWDYYQQISRALPLLLDLWGCQKISAETNVYQKGGKTHQQIARVYFCFYTVLWNPGRVDEQIITDCVYDENGNFKVKLTNFPKMTKITKTTENLKLYRDVLAIFGTKFVRKYVAEHTTENTVYVYNIYICTGAV